MSKYIATIKFGTPTKTTRVEKFAFTSRATKTGTVTSHARVAAEKVYGTDEFLVTAVVPDLSR